MVAAESGLHVTRKDVVEVVTHMIGFIIVFWILKRFAWRPLLKVMEERRQKISSEFDRIEELNQEVQKRREEYESRIQTIETEARERINAAVNEGRRVASEIQANARRDAEKIREKARATVEIEVAKAREQLREEVVNLTLLATEKLIHERLDDEKHRSLITQFVDELKN
jgi:F-type H+-transporting ATPase subunit b